MKLLERMYETSKSDTSSSSSLRLGMPSLSGVVLSNSVPPTGYRSMTMRTMKQLQIQKTWLILKGFVLKRAAADIDVCRSLFFCQEDCACVEESDLAR